MDIAQNNSKDKTITADVRGQRRVLMLALCAILQLSVGISYIWGIFQPYIMDEFGWDVAKMTIPFTMASLMFVVGSWLGGTLQSRLSPRFVVIIGGTLIGAGCLTTLFVTSDRFWVFNLAYGVLVGIGFGVSYNQAVSLSQKWFYDKRGFAGGVVVAALGVSGMISTPIASHMLSNYGVKATYVAVGITFFAMNFIISFFIKDPPKGWGLVIDDTKTHFVTKQYTPKEMLKTHNFYILFICLLCCAVTFTLINPVWIIIGELRGIKMEILIGGMMAISLMNAIGRLVASSLSDRIGRKLTLMILYVVSILATAGIYFLKGGIWIIPCFAMVAFCYGGFFATFPAVTTDSFGVRHAGSNYGYVMIGLGAASICAMAVASALATAGISLDARCIPGILFGITGLILVFFIKQPKQA